VAGFPAESAVVNDVETRLEGISAVHVIDAAIIAELAGNVVVKSVVSAEEDNFSLV